jgi:hypothetical protein
MESGNIQEAIKLERVSARAGVVETGDKQQVAFYFFSCHEYDGVAVAVDRAWWTQEGYAVAIDRTCCGSSRFTTVLDLLGWMRMLHPGYKEHGKHHFPKFRHGIVGKLHVILATRRLWYVVEVVVEIEIDLTGWTLLLTL